MHRDKFCEKIRPHLNLTTENVFGMNRVLTYIEHNRLPVEHAAYGLATAWWETAQKMQPVREAFWLSENWRRKNLRYWPYYGRSLVQLTWKENYRKAGEMLGIGDELVNDPNKALEWEFALPLLFEGMKRGLYTGKQLGDFFDEDSLERDSEQLREYIAARRMINGTDKARTIANLALVFENALEYAGHVVPFQPGEPTVLPVLELGMRGTWVRKAQQLLNAKGFDTGEPDGIFGDKTLRQVVLFQTRGTPYKIGKIGPATWNDLTKVTA